MDKAWLIYSPYMILGIVGIIYFYFFDDPQGKKKKKK
jgi:hypothetical protein